jgi:hypothetical protein
MKDPKRYITFKIETAENMSRDKIILLVHPDNKEILSMLLYRLQTELGYEEGEE